MPTDIITEAESNLAAKRLITREQFMARYLADNDLARVLLGRIQKGKDGHPRRCGDRYRLPSQVADPSL